MRQIGSPLTIETSLELDVIELLARVHHGDAHRCSCCDPPVVICPGARFFLQRDLTRAATTRRDLAGEIFLGATAFVPTKARPQIAGALGHCRVDQKRTVASMPHMRGSEIEPNGVPKVLFVMLFTPVTYWSSSRLVT